MLLTISALIGSIIPSIVLLIFLNKRQKENPLYQKKYKFALLIGVLSVIPILLLSGTLFLIIRFSGLQRINILLYEAVYTIIVLAFSEEIIKYLGFRILLIKNNNYLSWADIAALMVIIGTMFGLSEDIPYAIDASPIVILVRGLTVGHSGYGFIMGWFYGKKLSTGKKRYGVIAVLLPSLIHGIYDFSLSPELLKINENLAFLGVGLALLDIVIAILMISFFIVSRKKGIYNTPIGETADQTN